MHEVLVNRLGGLSLPRKSVVRLTDRPDMTLDVHCGRKTTVQQQQPLQNHPNISISSVIQQYKMGFIFQNDPKNLDPFCKMDLDFLDGLEPHHRY